jgi:hypothetical protein
MIVETPILNKKENGDNMILDELFEKNKKEIKTREISKNTVNYNLDVIKGEVMLDIANGDETTPKVPWSSNLYPNKQDVEVETPSKGWGLKKLEDGQIVQTFIKEGSPVAYIISKKNAIKQIAAYRKYELLEPLGLSEALCNLLK